MADASIGPVRITLRHHGVSHVVDVESERTVGELKQQLFVHLAGIPTPLRQKLICCGEVLSQPEQRVGSLCGGSGSREVVVMLIEVLAPATRLERYRHVADNARVRMAERLRDAWRLMRTVSLRHVLQIGWRNTVLFVTTLLIPPPAEWRRDAQGGVPHRPAA